FFFQAEDGIRDFHVTGVQTCALPIFLVEDRQVWKPVACPDLTTGGMVYGKGRLAIIDAETGQSVKCMLQTTRAASNPVNPLNQRSEERRVGKEWRHQKSVSEMVEERI